MHFRCKHCVLDPICTNACELDIGTVVLAPTILNNLKYCKRIMSLVDKYYSGSITMSYCYDECDRVEITSNGMVFKKHSTMHRVGGPAVILKDYTFVWRRLGVIHRDDGPARIHSNGVCEWWQLGQQIKVTDKGVLPKTWPYEWNHIYWINKELENANSKSM